MVSKFVQFSFGIMFLFVFVFSMTMTDTQDALAEEDPPSLLCCDTTGWCASDTSLTKHGWPDPKQAGKCIYGPPDPGYEACYIFVPICME